MHVSEKYCSEDFEPVNDSAHRDIIEKFVCYLKLANTLNIYHW